MTIYRGSFLERIHLAVLFIINSMDRSLNFDDLRNRKIGENNFINKYLFNIKLLFYYKYVIRIPCIIY